MSDDLQQVAECSGRKCGLYLQLHIGTLRMFGGWVMMVPNDDNG